MRADGKKIKHVAINEKLQAENDRKKKKVPSHFHSDAFLSPSRFFCGQRVNGQGEGENLDMSTKFDDSDRQGELKIRQKFLQNRVQSYHSTYFFRDELSL